MAKTVDSFRFLDVATRTVVKAWISREPQHDIPWTPLRKPLSECTVALVSSAAIARREDPPFDQERERRNPWWGDPSFRIIPRGTTEQDIRLHHLHIERSFGEQDLDCVLPIRRLEELQSERVIGCVAPSHYSFMGFLLKPREFLERSVPAIITRLKQEAVDVVAIVPV
jgi:D-proline reductase (dithiol) PrdB